MFDAWQGWEYVFRKYLYFLKHWRKPSQLLVRTKGKRSFTESGNPFLNNNHAKNCALIYFFETSLLNLKFIDKDWFSWKSFKDWGFLMPFFITLVVALNFFPVRFAIKKRGTGQLPPENCYHGNCPPDN